MRTIQMTLDDDLVHPVDGNRGRCTKYLQSSRQDHQNSTIGTAATDQVFSA